MLQNILKIQDWILVILLLGIVSVTNIKSDIIMMGMNGGAPSIIDDDDGPDFILMPGMSNMMINDDLVL
jgi:hypothetical protein